MSPDGDVDGPPGTARTRTRLSWRRTGLSSTAVLLLTVRVALRLDSVLAATTIIALGLLGWLSLMGLCQRRMASISGSPPPPAGRLPATLALGIAGFAVLGIAAAVLL